MLSYKKVADNAYTSCLYLAIATAIAAPISTALTSLFGVSMLLAWLLSGRAISSLKISYQQPVGKIILLFFSWLIIGILYVDNDWGEGLKTLSSWKKLLFVFILLGLFYQQKWKQRFISSYIYVMSFAAVVAIILWSLDITVRGGGSLHTPGTIMTNYVTQSMAFIAAIIGCIFLLTTSTSRPKKGVLWGIIALLVFNIFFISGARSAYVALPIAVVFAVVTLYGYKKLPHIFSVFSLVLVALFFSSATVQDRVEKGVKEFSNFGGNTTISSVGIRMVLVENTLALIEEKPIIGYGTSSFESAYGSYVAKRYAASDWRSASTTDPHNIYLYVLLENGTIGLLIFLAYIYISIRQGLQQSPYGMIAASFLVAICISSLFNSHFKTFPEGYLLAFFSGILLSQYKLEILPEKRNHNEVK